MNLLKAFPFFIFALILISLCRGLSLHPNEIPSPLIGKPAPEFVLPNLLNEKKFTTNDDFLGHITLVNVWASWCMICLEEHTFLMKLAKDKNIFIYGLNYKDDPVAAKKWLELYGNPYQIIALDAGGMTAIDWGVYGTPETFILDKEGMIRYKIVGALTSDAWENELKPFIEKLQKES